MLKTLGSLVKDHSRWKHRSGTSTEGSPTEVSLRVTTFENTVCHPVSTWKIVFQTPSRDSAYVEGLKKDGTQEMESESPLPTNSQEKCEIID